VAFCVLSSFEGSPPFISMNGEVKVRDFMYELNDDVRLPDKIIDDAIAKFGRNGISFRSEVKNLDPMMLGLLEIDSRLHKPITLFFKDIDAKRSQSSRQIEPEPSDVSPEMSPDVFEIPADDMWTELARSNVRGAGKKERKRRPEVFEFDALDVMENGHGRDVEVKKKRQVKASRFGMVTAEEKKEKKRRTDLCVFCGKKPEEYMGLTLSCKHTSCTACLHDMVVKATKERKGLPVKCKACRAEIPQTDIRNAVYPHELEKYDEALLQALITADEKMVECINPKCRNVIEMVTQTNLKVPKKILEKDSRGNPLSVAAWKHYKQYRLRCNMCNTIFCANCKTSPYHMGYDCEGWVEYKNAKQCRYCSEQITYQNEHKMPSSSSLSALPVANLVTFLQDHGVSRAQIRAFREKPLLVKEAKRVHKTYRCVFGDICDAKECKEKRDLACTSILQCGHPCQGIRGESHHLPCMKCREDLDENEFCPVCYVESLKDAPCIQSTGKCKHIFHLKCVVDRINAGYNGARINFKFITCPLCNQEIEHPALLKPLKPWRRMRKKIQRKALQRLKYEKRTKDPKIASKFGGDMVAFAMHEYLFYKCFKCKEPYFAGNYACQAADDGKFDPAELLCAGCQPSENVNDCKVHGTEWIAFKCRFCCNTAQWYCWNNTHFCGKCHKPRVWQTLVTYRKGTNKKKIWEYPQCAGLKSQVERIRDDNRLDDNAKMKALKELRSDPRTCPLKRRHPPNGFEFGLGCTMCADAEKKH